MFNSLQSFMGLLKWKTTVLYFINIHDILFCGKVTIAKFLSNTIFIIIFLTNNRRCLSNSYLIPQEIDKKRLKNIYSIRIMVL